MRADTLKKDTPRSSVDETLRAVLVHVLGLSSDRARQFTRDTPLFGALPELDSMAVATLLTEIEDRFSILIDDDDIDGETFENFGTLSAFVQSKLD